MAQDIEHLKQNKIGLPTMQDEPDATETEAYGGSGEKPEGPVDKEAIKDRVNRTLKTVYDPEIPVNIQELGLIYDVEVREDAHVEIQMTLTAPACPVAGMIVQEVAQKVGNVEGVSTSHVELVWDPPWTPERMSEEAKLELGLL